MRILIKVIKNPLVLGIVFGLVAGLYFWNMNSQINNLKNKNIQLQALLEQKKLETTAYKSLTIACAEREKEAQTAISEREKIVNNLKYQLKEEKSKEELCNELEEESRKLVIDRLNRNY